MGKVIFRDTELSSSNSTYELAVANGYKGTKEEFYKMLITVGDKANKSDTYTKTEVDTAINNHKIDVDSALSDTSENPVQNKIITSALNGTLKKWVGTKADYDKLTSYDDNTIYIVTDQDSGTFIDSKSFDLHVKDINNPHKVTAAQVGAYTKEEVDSNVGTAVTNLTTKVNKLSDDMSKLKPTNGVVVSGTAPTTNDGLWIDTANGGIAKYYDSTAKAWTTVKAVWG